ncbi:hypothetical protein A3K42_00055 [candidate division WWE3 bacterium RBG_13_37_7]|uniref:Glycosyltransferase 2-like domain-containing protein n=1 Tax=candidate division WWE3 bacterium RBG_13_37_7 TaxID=1802609 RepID=A0A1F4U209_UNCKA|nr:MAG: hypothetical protein A3K42_00055 [candidate division WWE3 bacterium RBG_13_37_7]
MCTLKIFSGLSFKEKAKTLLYALLGIQKRYEIPKDWNEWKITVLIPAYNESGSIENTIKSIQAQTIFSSRVGPEVKILVVDDCSSDNTGSIAKRAGATVMRTPKNTGTKAQAQNYALKQMRADEKCIVVTIDADTILDSDALEKIVLPLQDDNVVSACGFVIPQRIKTFWERARFIAYIFDISIAKHGQSFVGTPLVSSGCFSAYKVKVLKDYGFFSERTMVEDMDLTWTQLLDKGSGKKPKQRVVLVEDATCYPIDPPTYKIYKAQMSRWLRGFLQVIEQHKFAIFKRPSLAFFALWNLIEGILSPLVVVMFVYSLLKTGFNSRVALYLVVFWISGLSIVIVSSLIVGFRKRKIVKVITSLPCYFLVVPVNAYMFWYALWKQWILREKLMVWEKGH